MNPEPICMWVKVGEREVAVQLSFDYYAEEPATCDNPGHSTEITINEAIVVSPGYLEGLDILDQLNCDDLESHISEVLGERKKLEQQRKRDQEAEYADFCYQEWKEEGVPMWQHRRP